MSETDLSSSDRRVWLAATTVAGGAGMAAVAVPFVVSMAPSERARAVGAPVEVDLASIGPGQLETVEWRGKPVWLLHRTPEMLETLTTNIDVLSDSQSTRSIQPPYAQNSTRSIKPELAVIVAICTHLGCIPSFRPDADASDLGASWPGGFYCPCHGSKFDYAGRVYRNVPAPTNLEVPPHHYLSDNFLVIGEDAKA